MENSKKSVIKSSFNYTIVQYAVMGIGFIKSIYVANALTPIIMGSYGLIVLVLDYLRFAHLGVFMAMNLESSVNMGNSDKIPYVRQITDNSFTYLFFLTILFIVGACIVSALPDTFIASDIKKYVFAIAFIAAIDQYKIFTIIYSRLNEKYQLINRIELWSNVLLCIVVLFTVSKYKLDAVVYSMVLSSVLMLLLCAHITGKNIRVSLKVNIIKKLMIIGAPLLIYNIFERFFMTVDRVIISNYLTRSDLGYFTLSSTIVSSTMVLLSSFTFLYYPKVLQKMNTKDQIKSTKEVTNDIKNFSTLISCVALTIGFTGLILIEPFIRIFLSDYIPSITIYQLLILGILADNTTYFASTYLASNKHQIALIAILLVMATISIPLNLIAIKFNLGLNGIALATSLSMFLYAVAKVVFTFKKLGELNTKNVIEFFYKYVLFATVIIAIIFLMPKHIYLGIPALYLLYRNEFRSLYTKLMSEFKKL